MTPPNGYYIARVNHDIGGTFRNYVHVHDGVIRANDGNELRSEACSEFSPVSTQQFCAVWPDLAAKELDAARVRIEQLEGETRANDTIRQLREAGHDLHAELINARYRLRLLGYERDLPGDQAIKRWGKLTL